MDLDFNQALTLLVTAWDANASDEERKKAAEALVKGTYQNVLLPIGDKKKEVNNGELSG